MLLDGAVRFAYMAQDGLESSDHEKIYAGFTQCRDIVLELTNTIDPSHDPELDKQVRDIYVFLYGELVSASIDKNIAQLNKAIELLEFERETWAQLMVQLVKDRRAGLVAGTVAGAIGAGGDMPSLSIQA